MSESMTPEQLLASVKRYAEHYRAFHSAEAVLQQYIELRDRIKVMTESVNKLTDDSARAEQYLNEVKASGAYERQALDKQLADRRAEAERDFQKRREASSQVLDQLEAQIAETNALWKTTADNYKTSKAAMTEELKELGVACDAAERRLNDLRATIRDEHTSLGR